MKSYTVIALYADNLQRWAETYEASTPEQAIALARADRAEHTMLIAAVLEGQHFPVDDGWYAHDNT